MLVQKTHQPRAYYPALDGLRALAVLAVFVHHYLPNLLPEGFRFGWVGVDVFFVLSGFLITGILYDSRHEAGRWRTFYVRRTLRIFPLFYGVLLLVFLLTPYLHWNWSWRWLSLPGYFFNVIPTTVPGHPGQTLGYLQGHLANGTPIELAFLHFWTLCVEEQFYLLWPAVVFFVKDRRMLLRVVAFTIPFILLLRTTIFLHLHGEHTIFLLVRPTYARADSLMMGAALALLLRGPSATRVMRQGGPLLGASLTLFCLLRFLAIRVLHQSASSEPDTSWIATLGFTLIAGAASGVLLLTLRPATWLSRGLQWAPLRWLGQRSYGFYVFHLIWLQPLGLVAAHLLRWAGMNAPDRSYPMVGLQAGLAFVVTLAVSAASYRWFEQPFLRLKERLTHRPRQDATQQIQQRELQA